LAQGGQGILGYEGEFRAHGRECSRSRS
jgi:hypothetical protein